MASWICALCIAKSHNHLLGDHTLQYCLPLVTFPVLAAHDAPYVSGPKMEEH